MVAFKKKALRCKSRKEKIVFEKFDVGAVEKAGVCSAVRAKNCDTLSGALKTGVGMEELLLENDVKVDFIVTEDVRALFLWETVGENALFEKTVGAITADGCVWFFNMAVNSWQLIQRFDVPMRAISARNQEGENLLILYGETGVFACVYLGELKKIYPYETGAACVYGGRLFLAVDGKKIVYSAPYDPTDFAASIDDGGAVELPSDWGKIVEIVSFQNEVCILYEYGLGVLKIAGSAREFKFEKIGYGGGKIFEHSAGVCSVDGEKLFFLAEDGVYVFDGTRAKKCCENLSIQPIGHTQVCSHAQFDGKYFVSFIDKSGEKKGIVVDAESGKGYESFVPFGLSSSLGEALCSGMGYVCKLKASGQLPETETAEFYVEKLRFGGGEKTLLHGLRFFGKGTIEVVARCGEHSKGKTLSFENGEIYLPLRLRGREFSFQIRLDAGAEIWKLEAETETLLSVGK